MTGSSYVVRTIYLANYFAAAADMARARHRVNTGEAEGDELVRAMRRTEMADQALQDELNQLTSRGYRLIDTIVHPTTETGRQDLLITVILAPPAGSPAGGVPSDAGTTTDSSKGNTR